VHPLAGTKAQARLKGVNPILLQIPHPDLLTNITGSLAATIIEARLNGFKTPMEPPSRFQSRNPDGFTAANGFDYRFPLGFPRGSFSD